MLLDFYRFALIPCTLNRHENGAFRKHSSNRMNSRTPPFIFVRTEDILKDLVDFHDRVFLKAHPFLRRSADGKRLLIFQSKASRFKFLGRRDA